MAALGNVDNLGPRMIRADAFQDDEICVICQGSDKLDDDGQALELIGHEVLRSGVCLEQDVEHVFHKNCFIGWVNSQVPLKGESSESLLKCLVCQRIMRDVTGILIKKNHLDVFINKCAIRWVAIRLIILFLDALFLAAGSSFSLYRNLYVFIDLSSLLIIVIGLFRMFNS